MHLSMKLLLAVSAMTLGAQGALAQQFNGGLPGSWTCTGDCGTSPADGVVTLPSNPLSNRYGWVSTYQGVAGVSPYMPPPSPGGGGLVGNTDGSTLRSNAFVANGGEQLSFDFNYVTSDGATYTDYAWARLLRASDLTQYAVLVTARTNYDPTGGGAVTVIPVFGLPTPDATLSPASVPIIDAGYSPGVVGPNWTPLGPDYNGTCWDIGCGYTGWINASYTIADPGNYILEFGVTNWDDTLWDSGLAFDGATIAGVEIDDDSREARVPEPATLGLFALALIGLGGVRHRQG